MTEPQQAATFQIEKVYVKDLSLEIPHAPQVYAEQTQPQIDVRIESGESRFQQDYYEVTLSATIIAREADLGPLLGIACPTVLFPYLRETISDLITRGGFPPLLLTPISFEQLYLQRMQQQDSGAPRIETAS